MDRINVPAILEELGIKIRSESETHYQIMCPIHYNTQTASATVSKRDGMFWCFNPSCVKQMSLSDLIRRMRGWDSFKILRYIERNTTDVPLDEIIKEIYASKDEMPEFPREELLRLQEQFRHSDRAKSYVASRGISGYAARDFGLAYDVEHDMICTPMFDINGNPVGLIRRSIEGKQFKNTKNLPTSKTLFNINNARRAGSDTLILTESNFDAIRVHQAGFRNVCATLGGTFSDYHVSQVYRSFDSLILMTDNDEAARDFDMRIFKKCKKFGVAVYRARYNEYNLFPNDAKDICDKRDGEILVTEKDIEKCIKNASIFY